MRWNYKRVESRETNQKGAMPTNGKAMTSCAHNGPFLVRSRPRDARGVLAILGGVVRRLVWSGPSPSNQNLEANPSPRSW